MDNLQKVDELRNLINSTLSPLIDNDYVLWDLPYHGNIGDILIWEGELSFLKSLKYKCLNYSNSLTCVFPELPDNIIILLHGGGNFGDVWREAQDFRLRVIEKYSKNRIIIFPQTVFYSHSNLINLDAANFALHDKLTICARDRKSFDLLKKYFSNNILLLPDMAFCISEDYLKSHRADKRYQGGKLLVRRLDKERIDICSDLFKDCSILDWPTFEKVDIRLSFLYLLFRFAHIFNFQIVKRLIDLYFKNIVRRLLIIKGVTFIDKYEEIYTTRLHALILSVLLEKKKILFLDNNYGKCASFCKTWLSDLDSVKPFLLKQ